MTDRQIISLLKRYMDGATTVEEETALADFFCTATDADRPDAISAADWNAYREMFCMFASEAAEKDQQNEAATTIVQRFTLRNTLLWVASVAAVAVLVFAVSALLPDNTVWSVVGCAVGSASGSPCACRFCRRQHFCRTAAAYSCRQPEAAARETAPAQVCSPLLAAASAEGVCG